MLPDLIIIGALKAGTTSLHQYLDQHPEIAMSRRKELNFFGGPGRNWDLGLAWYESQFDGSDGTLCGESSTSYSLFPLVQGVPQRIHDLVPDVKFIYALRDPITRMKSQFTHLRGEGLETRTIAEVLDADDFEDSAYVMRSRYGMQLEQYLNVFRPEQMHIVVLEDLRSNAGAVMTDLFRFLDVDPNPAGQDWTRARNEAKRYPVLEGLGKVLPQRTVRSLGIARGVGKMTRAWVRPANRVSIDSDRERRLIQMLKPDIDSIRAFTGLPLEQWSV